MVNLHLQFVEWAQFPHMPKHIFNRCSLIALCPQKFLKVHREHIVIFFIADTVAFDFFIIHAQHGAAADHIEPTVLIEKLEGRCNFRKFCNFIKKQQRFVRNKFPGWVNQRYIFDNRGCLIAVCKDAFIFFIPDKIDLHNTFIGFCGKLPDGLGFSNLTAPFDDKRFSGRVCLPFTKKRVYFSFQIHGIFPPLFFSYTLSIHIFKVKFNIICTNHEPLSRYFSHFPCKKEKYYVMMT